MVVGVGACRVVGGLVLGHRQALGELVELGAPLVTGPLDGRLTLGEALGLGLRAAHGLGEPAQAPSGLGAGGVVGGAAGVGGPAGLGVGATTVVADLAGDADLGACRRLGLLGGLEAGVDLADAAVGGGEPVARLVRGRLHLQQALVARRAALRPVGAEEVAGARHRPQVGVVADDRAGGGEVVDDHRAGEDAGDGAGEVVGGADEVGGPAGTGGRIARGRLGRPSPDSRVDPRFASSPGDQQPRPPSLRGVQLGERVGGGVGARHRHRVRGQAQRRGDRVLVTRRHPQQRGHRPEHPGHPVGRAEQRAGAVAPGEAEREGVGAGLPVRAVALGVAVGRAGAVDLGARRLVALDGGVERGLGVGGVRVVDHGSGGLVVVVRRRRTGLLLGRGELLAGGPGALVGLGERRRDLRELLGGGGQAPAQRLDLPGQARHALAAVGGGAGGRGEAALGGGERVLGGLALLRMALEDRAGLGDLLLERRLVPRGLVGLALEVVGVRAGGRVLGRRDVTVALGGERDGAAQALLQRREAVPALLGTGVRRRRGLDRGLERRDPLAHLGQRALGLVAPGPGGVLVGLLALDLIAQGHQVVGGQAQAGVAQVGLDGLGAPGDLGLPAQRLELATELGGEVGQAREVRLHRLELAERLLLALAVLEDARGLLDERPPLLGPRLQDRVELALADEHVQLAADAGVREELLDVEQAAAAAVDLVLARAGAEHAPGDRHLGVGDGERAVGVVDGQRDLGAAQRGAPRGAGEDDVLHLAAAQRLGPLLAEHPADRVDHVGLARPVGPDHARDARLEAQRRRGREGLEALERQALQVHADVPPPPVCRDATRGARQGDGPPETSEVSAVTHRLRARTIGDPGDMATATHYLEINAPAAQCYQWWRPLTNLPQIMDDVRSVDPKDGSADVTHWVVDGPLGKTVEWDAKIIDEETDRKIAWKSLEESNNHVETGGAVRFDPHGDSTGVEVSLHVQTPGGSAGDAVAKLFADPQKKIEKALEEFKQLMERSSQNV